MLYPGRPGWGALPAHRRGLREEHKEGRKSIIQQRSCLSLEMQLPCFRESRTEQAPPSLPCCLETAWVGPRKHRGQGSGGTGQPAGTPPGRGRSAAGWRRGAAPRAARASSHSHLQGQKQGEGSCPDSVESSQHEGWDPGRGDWEKTDASLLKSGSGQAELGAAHTCNPGSPGQS